MQCGCSSRRLQLFSVFLATVAIVVVLIILFISNYPGFARNRVLDMVVFRDGSIEMERFKSTADLVNLRVSFSLFTVTNPDDVVKKNATIKLQEIGPFVYHELKTKELIDNNQTSGLLTFKLRKRYTFQPQLSVGDPKKINVTWPNVPLIVARSYLDRLNFFERNGAYLLFNRVIRSMSEPAFMTDTVDNLIFSGSKRDLFEQLEKAVGALFNPWPLKDNRFGILYGKNDSWVAGKDHVFTVSAGFGVNQTVANLNQYVAMNYSAELPFWKSDNCDKSSTECNSTCNKLEGTDGQFFSPFQEPSGSLTAYSVDICRKLELKYRGKETIRGVVAQKYSLAETSFQSGFNYQPNACYCIDRYSDGNPRDICRLDGLIDLSTCVAPNVMASGSHFLYGDKQLSTRVIGVKSPNISLDEPMVFVEPNVGFTIQTRVPLQLNIKLEKGGFDLFSFFKDEQPLVIPLLTLIEAAEITEDQASMLRGKLMLLDLWFVSVVLGGTIVFILAIIATVVIVCIRYRRTTDTAELSETDPLIAPESSEQNVDSTSDLQRSSSYNAI